MIYNTGFFRKEFRQAYIEDSLGRKKLIGFGTFIALLSFSIFFILQTVTRTVLIEVIPEFMLPSYFSTLYLYTNIAFICNIIYFIIYYEYLTFAEVLKNRWYMLVQMGYSPVMMILTKIVVRIFSVLLVYSVGFVITLLLTAFMKYNFIFEYFVPLYLVGAINIILIVIVSLLNSLFINNTYRGKVIIVLMAMLIIIFQIASGYYSLVSDRSLMRSIDNLFDITKSPFLPIATLIFVLSVIGSVFVGKYKSKYYNLSYKHYNTKVSINNLVNNVNRKVVINESIDNRKIFNKQRKNKDTDNPFKEKENGRVVEKLISIITTISILVVILVNAFILVVTLASTQKEISIFNKIPYVFQSETMEPTIMFNDLAFFEKIDDSVELEQDQIIIFTSMNQTSVARIKKVIPENGNDKYEVDIDKYYSSSSEGQFKEVINRNDIYGIYVNSNRWLGAIILFANTTIGRLMFLLIPVALLFFNKQITKITRKIYESTVLE